MRCRFFSKFQFVQDHAHGDEVGLGQRIVEKIPAHSRDAVRQPGGGDVLARDGRNGRQIEADAAEMRMPLRAFDAQQPGRAADVAERPKFREGKFLREQFEVHPREARHRAHELFSRGRSE